MQEKISPMHSTANQIKSVTVEMRVRKTLF